MKCSLNFTHLIFISSEITVPVSKEGMTEFEIDIEISFRTGDKHGAPRRDDLPHIRRCGRGGDTNTGRALHR